MSETTNELASRNLFTFSFSFGIHTCESSKMTVLESSYIVLSLCFRFLLFLKGKDAKTSAVLLLHAAQHEQCDTEPEVLGKGKL